MNNLQPHNSINVITQKDNLNFDDIESEPILKLKNKIKKRGYFCPTVNLENIKSLDKFSKKLIKLYNYSAKKHFDITNQDEKLINVYVGCTPKENLELLSKLFYILSINDTKKRYEYIYDDVCDTLDKLFSENNYCKFENNVCICQREVKHLAHHKDGCCYTFHYRKFDNMPISDERCKELRPGGGCDVKSFACKLFTCKYLKSLGIKFSCDSFFLTRIYLNKKQKAYLESCFFIRREKNIEGLLALT